MLQFVLFISPLPGQIWRRNKSYWLEDLLSLYSFNPFPHDKNLDQTKLKAFAEDKLNVTKMIVSMFDRIENIVGKGEIACTSNFSFSHNVFKRLLSQTREKVSLYGNGLI